MKYFLPLLVIIISFEQLAAQAFPNPATLSTGQGAIGTLDPVWKVSPYFTSLPPNPMGLTYSPAYINNNCAPGSWVNPAALPAPINNGNWITESNNACTGVTPSGYVYFRLPLNLPPDCNGRNIAVSGSYTLYLSGYADDRIYDVFVNGISKGISGGTYSLGGQINMTLPGPWQVGMNYVDVLVFNKVSNPVNPYGLVMVANYSLTSTTDSDGDGVPDLYDQCPCDPGNQPDGCGTVVTGNTEICLGDSTRLTSNRSGTYRWSTGSTSSSIMVSPAVNTNYRLTVTATNGVRDSFNFAVQVNPTYNRSVTQTICAGSSYRFNGVDYNQPGTYSAVFQSQKGCDSTITLQLSVLPVYRDTLPVNICEGDVYTYQNNSFSLPGYYTVRLAAITGCDSTIVIALTNRNSDADTVFASICPNNSYQLPDGRSVSTTGWYQSAFKNISNCDSIIHTYLQVYPDYHITRTESICENQNYRLPDGSMVNSAGTYVTTLSTIHQCDSIINTIIIVNSEPSWFRANISSVPQGEKISLVVQTNQTGNLHYNWSPADSLSCTDCSAPYYLGEEAAHYSVTVTDDNGCRAYAAVDVDLLANYDVFIPNVFTPNGDGNNDLWQIYFKKNNVRQLQVCIYNRWGEKVFETNDTNFTWDGWYKGAPAPEALYTYTVSMVWMNNASFQPYKGSLTLLR